MTRATVDATLPAPPERVFDFLADVRNEARWHPDFRWATKRTDGPVGTGTVFDVQYRGLGRMRVRVVEADRPVRLVFHAASRALEMDVHFHFSREQGGGTLVDCGACASLRGRLGFATPLVAPLLRRELAKRPDQLRRGLEEGSVAGG